MTAQPTRDQLRALAEAAAEGSWEAERIHHRPHGQSPHHCWEVTVDEQPIIDCIREDEYDAAETAQFIAAARNALPQLLDQLDEAEARIERLENRAETETARANEWRRKHHVMAGKRDAAHRAYMAELAERRAAETRVKAVEDVLDNPIHLTGWDDPLVPRQRHPPRTGKWCHAQHVVTLPPRSVTSDPGTQHQGTSHRPVHLIEPHRRHRRLRRPIHQHPPPIALPSSRRHPVQIQRRRHDVIPRRRRIVQHPPLTGPHHPPVRELLEHGRVGERVRQAVGHVDGVPGPAVVGLVVVGDVGLDLVRGDL